MSETIIYRWIIEDDGGGTLYLFTDDGTQVVESEIDFTSLDELPTGLAKAIRGDGGTRGEFPPKPKE